MKDGVSTTENGWLASHTKFSTSLSSVACVTRRGAVKAVIFAFFTGVSLEEEDLRFLWASSKSVYLESLLG